MAPQGSRPAILVARVPARFEGPEVEDRSHHCWCFTGGSGVGNESLAVCFVTKGLYPL